MTSPTAEGTMCGSSTVAAEPASRARSRGQEPLRQLRGRDRAADHPTPNDHDQPAASNHVGGLHPRPTARPGQALSPTAIAKRLDRSAGAVANALQILADQGAVVLSQA